MSLTHAIFGSKGHGFLDPTGTSDAGIESVKRESPIRPVQHGCSLAFTARGPTLDGRLLALQPNIRLHIVAPSERREKVLTEIRRPVFSLLDRGPLAESCTLISYESLHEIAKLPHLAHLSDKVLEEYTEEADRLRLR